MVRVDVAMKRATREPATRIARIQRAAQSRWNASGLASDVEHFAVIILNETHEAGVAGYLARHIHCDRRTVLDLATAIVVILQSRRIDMHHDLIAVSGGLGWAVL